MGCSGGGKTTCAALLAQKLGIPHLELDSLYHQSGWNRLPTDEFRARVEQFTSQEEWVIDGNYISDVGDITWGKADAVIWMDTPRMVATVRVIRRTVGRVLLRKKLWNGNRESLREILSRDPERSIVVWAWKMNSKYTERYETAMNDARWRHIHFVRLKDRRAAQRFISSIDPSDRESIHQNRAGLGD